MLDRASLLRTINQTVLALADVVGLMDRASSEAAEKASHGDFAGATAQLKASLASAREHVKTLSDQFQTDLR